MIINKSDQMKLAVLLVLAILIIIRIFYSIGNEISDKLKVDKIDSYSMGFRSYDM